MTCYFHNRGPEYHWITDLYGRLNLPILPEVVRAFQKATQEQMKELEKKFDGTKQMRVSQKIARAEDQEEWKKWVKRQAILHTYGVEDEEDDSRGQNLCSTSTTYGRRRGDRNSQWTRM